jgi:hypothetical protein
VSEQRRPAIQPGRFRLLRFRKVAKGYLAGFCDVELSNGLQLVDLLIIAKGGKVWINLPSKPRLLADGVAARDAGGRVVYDTVARWNSRRLGEAFSAQVVALIDERHPGALPAH